MKKFIALIVLLSFSSCQMTEIINTSISTPPFPDIENIPDEELPNEGSPDEEAPDEGLPDEELPEIEKDPIQELKHMYYGRAMFSGDMLKAYDEIVQGIDTWEDNAPSMGEIGHIRMIDLLDKGIKITSSQLTTILSIMRKDIPAVYSQFPPARKIELENGFVKRFGFRYKMISHQTYLSDMKKINQQADLILSKISSDMTEAQKVRVIHDSLLQLVHYGGINLSESGDIRGAFLLFKLICDGYAKAFTFLLQKIGIMSIYIVGDTPSGLHAWNKVRIDGQWYNVDPTWNDGFVQGTLHHRYFLLNDAEFQVDHTPLTGQFEYTYPVSASTSYPLSQTEYSK